RKTPNAGGRGFGDVEIIGSVEREASRGFESGGECGGYAVRCRDEEPARGGLGGVEVAGGVGKGIHRSEESAVGSCGDLSVGGDFTYAVVPRVGDVDVSGGIQGDGRGRVELREDRRKTVAEIARLARASDGGDGSV